MSSSILKSSLKPSIKKPQTPGIDSSDNNPRKKRLSVKFSQNTEVRVIKASPRRRHNSPGSTTVLSSAAYAALKNNNNNNKSKSKLTPDGASDSSTDDVINDYVCQFSDGENTERRVQLINSGEDATLINDIFNATNFGEPTNMFALDSAPSLNQVADFYQPTQKISEETLRNAFGNNNNNNNNNDSLMDLSFSTEFGGDATNALGMSAPTLDDVAGFYEPTKRPSKKELDEAFQNLNADGKKKKKEKKKRSKKKSGGSSSNNGGIESNDNGSDDVRREVLSATDSSADSSVSLSAPPSLADVAGFYEPTKKVSKKELKKAFRKRSAANEPESSDTSTDISGGESGRRKSVVLDAPPSLADVADFYEPTRKLSKKELKKAFSSKSGRRKTGRKTLSIEENGLGSGYLPSSSDSSTSSSMSADVSTSFSEENSNGDNGEFTKLISSVVPHLSDLQDDVNNDINNNENNNGSNGGNKRRGTVIFNGVDDSMEFTQVGGINVEMDANNNDNNNYNYNGGDDESMNFTDCYSKPGTLNIAVGSAGGGGDDDMSLTNCLTQSQVQSSSFCGTNNDPVDMDIINTDISGIDSAKKVDMLGKGSPEFMITKNNMTVSFSNIKPPQNEVSVNSSNDEFDDGFNCEPTFLTASQFMESLSKTAKSFNGTSVNSSMMDLDTSSKAVDVADKENDNEKDKGVEKEVEEYHLKKVNFDVNEDNDSKKKKKYNATPAASQGKLERVPKKSMEVEASENDYDNDLHSKKVNFDVDEDNDSKKKKKYNATPAASQGKLERVPKKSMEVETSENDFDDDSHSKKVNFDVNEDNDSKKKKKYNATPAASQGKLERVPKKSMEVETFEDDSHSKKVNFDVNEDDDSKKKKKYNATPAASQGKLERVPKDFKGVNNDYEDETHSKKVNFDVNEDDDSKKKKKYNATPAASQGKLERVPKKSIETSEDDSHSKKVNFDVNEDDDYKKKKKYNATPAASQGKLERVPKKSIETTTTTEEEEGNKPTKSSSKKRKHTSTTLSTDQQQQQQQQTTSSLSSSSSPPDSKRTKRQVSFTADSTADSTQKHHKYVATPAATHGYLPRVPVTTTTAHKCTYSELIDHFQLRPPAKSGVYPSIAVALAGIPFPLNPPQTPGRAAPTALELDLRSASRGLMCKVLSQFQQVLERGELADLRRDVAAHETHLNSSESPHLYSLGSESHQETRRNALLKLRKLSGIRAETALLAGIAPQLTALVTKARQERVQAMRATLSRMRARLSALQERRSSSDAECNSLRSTLAEHELSQASPAAAARHRAAQALESDAPLVLMCAAATQTPPYDPRALLTSEERLLNTLMAACGCGRLGALWSAPRILPRRSVALTFAGTIVLTVDIPGAQASLSLVGFAAAAAAGVLSKTAELAGNDVRNGVWGDWASMCVNGLNEAVLSKVSGNKSLLGNAIAEVAWKLEDAFMLKADIEDVAARMPVQVVSQRGEPPAVVVTVTGERARLSVTLRAGLVDRNGVPCIMNHPAAAYSWDFAGPVTVWWWLLASSERKMGGMTQSVGGNRRVDVSKDDLFKKWDVPTKMSLGTIVEALRDGFQRVVQNKKLKIS